MEEKEKKLNSTLSVSSSSKTKKEPPPKSSYMMGLSGSFTLYPTSAHRRSIITADMTTYYCPNMEEALRRAKTGIRTKVNLYQYTSNKVNQSQLLSGIDSSGVNLNPERTPFVFSPNYLIFVGHERAEEPNICDHYAGSVSARMAPGCAA